MKYFFANLKRFDIPVSLGGINRLAPVPEWGASIVRQTDPFINSLGSRASCTLLLPEAHLLNALPRLPRFARLHRRTGRPRVDVPPAEISADLPRCDG